MERNPFIRNHKVIILISLFFACFFSIQIYSQELIESYNKGDLSTSNLFLGLNISEKSKKNSVIKMDSIITNSIQGSSSKHLFLHNENNEITEWLILGNTGSGWFNSIKHNMCYDNQNNLITEVELGWYLNGWDSLTQICYSYESGILSQNILQTYKNNSWENLARASYTYGTNKNLLNTKRERWINDEWQNSFLITNYYSEESRRDSILFQSWVNNEWQNDKKTYYYYSENGIDMDSLIVKTWTGFGWENYLMREIINDKNLNQIEQLDKIWDVKNWLNSIWRTFIFNEFNMVEYAYCYIWYNNEWENGDGDIVLQISDSFTIGFITNNLSVYYSTVVGISDVFNSQISEYVLSQNYPNPFNPTTTIKYTIPKTTKAKLVVYDLLGREIATLVNNEKPAGTYEVKFDASHLSSGVYFYKLQTDGFSATKKLILIR